MSTTPTAVTPYEAPKYMNKTVEDIIARREREQRQWRRDHFMARYFRRENIVFAILSLVAIIVAVSYVWESIKNPAL